MRLFMWATRHRVLAAVSVVGIVAIVTLVIAGLTGPAPQNTGIGVNPTPETTFAPPSSAAPVTAAPSPTIRPANRVEFVISGSVPASQFGEVDIQYGSDSSTNDVTLNALGGRVVYSMRFDPSAQYYSVDVSFISSGSIRCKIVVLGPPPDVPLVVSKGDATGGNSGGDCSAQAAPNNRQGTNWSNEQ